MEGTLRLSRDCELGRNSYFDTIARHVQAKTNPTHQECKEIQKGAGKIHLSPLQGALGWADWGQAGLASVPIHQLPPLGTPDTAGIGSSGWVPLTFPAADLAGSATVAQGTQALTVCS